MDWLTAFDELVALTNKASTLNPPASQESINEFEASLAEQDRVKGCRLPLSYQAFLLHCDGAYIDDRDSGTYIKFLSLGKDLTEYNDADSVLLDHEIETYYTFEPLVMIAMDEGSSFWALDPTQKREDGEMPVRYCDHESGDIYAQSEDFPSFILSIANRQLKYRGLTNPIIRGQ